MFSREILPFFSFPCGRTGTLHVQSPQRFQFSVHICTASYLSFRVQSYTFNLNSVALRTVATWEMFSREILPFFSFPCGRTGTLHVQSPQRFQFSVHICTASYLSFRVQPYTFNLNIVASLIFFQGFGMFRTRFHVVALLQQGGRTRMGSHADLAFPDRVAQMEVR